MSKRKKPSKQLRERTVQDTENEPLRLPDISVTPEVDDDPWDKPDRLTLRQRRFVEYYMGEAAGNATKAAKLAGYRDDNYNSLRVTAHEILTTPNVQRAIEREIGKQFGSSDDVRRSIAAIANANAADYLSRDANGKLVPDLEKMAEAGALGLIHQIDAEVIESSGSFKVVKRKLKMYDRLKALELLAKMNGQLIERRDVTSNGNTVQFTLNISGESPSPQSISDRISTRN